MNKDLIFFERTDMNKAIEKKFKKYILEVDDAIEAHGFKVTSYIDYAEDKILNLQNSTQKHFNEHGLLFINLLENSLDNVTDDIMNHTIEDASIRNIHHSPEKLNKKFSYLYDDLKELNERFLNSFKTII